MSTLGSESVLGHSAQLENQAILASDEILRNHFVKTRNTRSQVVLPWLTTREEEKNTFS